MRTASGRARRGIQPEQEAPVPGRLRCPQPHRAMVAPRVAVIGARHRRCETSFDPPASNVDLDAGRRLPVNAHLPSLTSAHLSPCPTRRTQHPEAHGRVHGVAHPEGESPPCPGRHARRAARSNDACSERRTPPSAFRPSRHREQHRQRLLRVPARMHTSWSRPRGAVMLHARQCRSIAGRWCSIGVAHVVADGNVQQLCKDEKGFKFQYVSWFLEMWSRQTSADRYIPPIFCCGRQSARG